MRDEPRTNSPFSGGRIRGWLAARQFTDDYHSLVDCAPHNFEDQFTPDPNVAPSPVEPVKVKRSARSSEAESLRAALSHSSELHRKGAFARLLDHLSAAQFAALEAELDALDLSPQVNLSYLFFRRWAEVDPESALDAAVKRDLSSPDLMGAGGDWYSLSALEAWAERDPTAALARLEQITLTNRLFPTYVRRAVLKLAMPKPGELPPRDALRRIRELQGDDEAGSAVRDSLFAILTEWAKSEPEAAWREVLALPSDGNGREFRELALGSVISALSGSESQRVLQWIEGLPNGAERGEIETRYVTTLAESGKARQAREYAMAMPEGASREKAVGELAAILLQKDAEAAKAFVADLPAADWKRPDRF